MLKAKVVRSMLTAKTNIVPTMTHSANISGFDCPYRFASHAANAVPDKLNTCPQVRIPEMKSVLIPTATPALSTYAQYAPTKM